MLTLVLHTALRADAAAHAILYSGCRGTFLPPAEDAEPVRLASKGVTLRGWLARGSQRPDAVIVVVPGHAANTQYAAADARMLHDAGFGVLTFEHRTCADTSLAASTGVFEAHDVQAAVGALNAAEIGWIGVMGTSEGGTAALLAAAEEPRIRAVAALGGYASLRDDVLDPAERPHGAYSEAVRRLMLFFFRVDGIPVDEAAPVEVIGDIAPRPVLLVYGEREARPGEMLHSAAGDAAELWIVPGAGHMEYESAAGAEYTTRLTTFFAQAHDSDAQTEAAK